MIDPEAFQREQEVLVGALRSRAVRAFRLALILEGGRVGEFNARHMESIERKLGALRALNRRLF